MNDRPTATDGGANRRKLRRQMARLRRRIDHRVVRYVDRGRWVRRGWRACRRANPTATLVAAALLAAATCCFAGRGLRWLDVQLRRGGFRQALRDLMGVWKRAAREPARPVQEGSDD